MVAGVPRRVGLAGGGLEGDVTLGGGVGESIAREGRPRIPVGKGCRPGEGQLWRNGDLGAEHGWLLSLGGEPVWLRRDEWECVGMDAESLGKRCGRSLLQVSLQSRRWPGGSRSII